VTDELLDRPAVQLRALMVTGQLSPTELMNATLARIHERNGELNAIVTLCADRAVEIAAAASRIRRDFGPLHGLPFTVKDSIEVAGVRTTAGSQLLHDNVARRSATVVERVIAAGAIFIGKTNCPEFGIGNLDTDNLVFGRTGNPHDPAYTPGGSSGGDSAAVAAGMSAFGIGTDYGGSVRWPAHCTGLAALRPTPGSLSPLGMLPHEPADGAWPGRRSQVQRELQTIGFLARSAGDLAPLLDVALGSKARPSAPALTGLRCSWFAASVDSEIFGAVVSAANLLAAAGLAVESGQPAGFEQAPALLAELRAAEGLPEIGWLSQGRADQLTPLVRDEVERVLPTARTRLAAEVSQARREILLFLQACPILLMPAGACTAFTPQRTATPRTGLDQHNRAVTLLGLPAAVVPVAWSSTGLPIGVQLAGRPGADQEVLAVAQLLQHAARFSLTGSPSAGRSSMVDPGQPSYSIR
jgi:Asp-tRNA(Asn)/Glu-tRNA(Gln) amidotransferase A subunit family amidase